MSASAPPAPRRIAHECIVLVMVGLPARGKSYIANKVVNYFCWLGYTARLFNVGSKRRQVVLSEPQDAGYFSADNKEAARQRDELAAGVLEDLLDWLEAGGTAAVFDATNTTAARRQAVLDACHRRDAELNVIFVESVCTDSQTLVSNMEQKVANSPDYRDWPRELALADLAQRIANYERVYEPLSNDAQSYVRVFDLQSKVICNHVHAALGHLFVSFLISLHIDARPVYITRALDTGSGGAVATPVFNGSASAFPTPEDLAALPTEFDEAGVAQSKRLEEFMRARLAFLGLTPTETERGTRLAVYTSTNPRALLTASAVLSGIASTTRQWSVLNPMDTGLLRGHALAELESSTSAAWASWREDSFRNRVPGGESGVDVTRRLSALVVEVERLRRPVLVVTHATTASYLRGYFDSSLDMRTVALERPSLSKGVVLEFVPSIYGWTETKFDLAAADDASIEALACQSLSPRATGYHS